MGSLLEKDQKPVQQKQERRFTNQFSTDELKSVIGNFETELREARKQNDKKVQNPILGYCSQGIIDMAIERRAISFRKDVNDRESWAVVLPAYQQWSEQMKAMKELVMRREYAEEKESEQLELLAKQDKEKEKVGEINPKDIPF